MNVLIKSAHPTEHGLYFEASTGKTTAHVNLWKDGSIWVLCASIRTAHRVGLGKSFPSVAAARDAYKSSAMKALISAAATASLTIAA